MVNLKLLVARILNRLLPTNAFVVESHQLYTSASPLVMSANGYIKETTKTFTKNGYYPISIVGWDNSGAGASKSFFYTITLSSSQVGTASVYYGMRSFHSAATELTLTIYILWAKVN